MNTLCGVYCITDGSPLPELRAKVTEAIAGGCKLLQYRDKSHDQAKRHAEAEALRALCADAHIPFIVNDDVSLALAIQADGVHLGLDDTALADARAELGAQAIIGVSCYNKASLALGAESAGADYVAFGRFFPSRSKPDAAQASPDLLIQARSSLNLPIAAIGGINAANARGLIECGANMIAVIDSAFGSDDIAASVAALAHLFNP